MTYPTYDDARGREAELLRLAQRRTIESEPSSERRSIFRTNPLLVALRRRRAPLRKPAIGSSG